MKLEEITIKQTMKGEKCIRLTMDGEGFWIFQKEVEAIVRALMGLIGRELDIMYIVTGENLREIEKIIGIR